MSGLFAYAKVAPTSALTAPAELHRAAAAVGHVVLPDNMVIETAVSLVARSARSSWHGLLDRMYEGDVLVVPTLGDLGHHIKEVCVTVKRLAGKKLRVHCLELGQGRVDLASAAGQPMMEVLAAVAAFEEKQRVVHMRQGVAVDSNPMSVRRKGRPPSLSQAQITEAHRLLAAGMSTVQVARRLGTSRQTIMRACRRKVQIQSIAATSRPSV